jgi:hypothetical protein
MTASIDGTRISFKGWGDGPAVLFSHGWPPGAEHLALLRGSRPPDPGAASGA